MVIESRVSQDRLDDVGTNSQLYVDAITQVLDSNRGDWGDGVYYPGGYEVAFGGVKQGGLNFIQIAKVSLVLEISADVRVAPKIARTVYRGAEGSKRTDSLTVAVR